MDTKFCNQCKEEKPFTCFHKKKRPNNENGLAHACKICLNKYYKEHHLNNKEKRKEKSKTWYLNNKDKLIEMNKTYHSSNREKRLQQQKEYYSVNREKIIERNKIYATNNRDKINKRTIENYRKDPLLKLKKSLRGRLYQALAHGLKSESSIELVGCSIEKLKLHLEFQFKEGMSWENWSFKGWHVDHIRPISSFDFSDPAQVKECFHYSNLQPLWAKDNLSKGDRLL